MSKNVTIQEGGVAKQLTVDKLKTNLVGGGTCNWVPEDDVQLTTKTITKNGTYKASDDGYYGYSEVRVSGVGTATGTGPDGETHSYTEDGSGGITDSILPDSISVETPPTLLAYADGATIDFTGLVVKAYLKSGNVWTDGFHPDGVIPSNELTFPVTAADYDAATGRTVESELDTSPVIQPILEDTEVAWMQSGTEGAYNVGYSWVSGTPHVCMCYKDAHSLIYLIASDTPITAVFHTQIGVIIDVYLNCELNSTFTYANKTVYYYFGSYGIMGNPAYLDPSSGFVNGGSPVEINSNTARQIAWTLVYGDTVTESGQKIPVQYLRSDGNTLESSFYITVTPSLPSA